MNLKDPDTMNAVIGRVLRYGVVVSAVVIVMGAVGLAISQGSTDTSGFLGYNQAVPHDGIDASPSGIISGLASFAPTYWILLGVVLLIATPVVRVLISVILFAAEKDRLYVLITAAVLTQLLFSIFITPSIPGFHA